MDGETSTVREVRCRCGYRNNEASSNDERTCGTRSTAFLLLALCARAQGHPRRCSVGTICQRAEAHGLVPLLWTHLHAAGLTLPSSTKQQLQAYYMQHAHATRVRAQVLSEILARFQ
jgi:hypothetical protein